ncbi:MAG: elongation factor G [Rhodospirillales bacterium]|jgi:elongation factor G|nr:elongation factor G [Rhodospirillaceae bacterium]MDP6429319.1 elongation factor G [Rhodospirillales bacterium]MDP6643129.1 elongation factor G [Rhodospirillales bacterium]MDP6842179.1 elongation factor G [Rhodospirillales bacterium]
MSFAWERRKDEDRSVQEEKLAAKENSAPRCAAIVGPYLSGKTSLLESMLNACGALSRKGSVGDGNTVGDSSPEARARGMSVELNVASAEYLGEEWTFIDCPGSVELAQEALNAMMVADVAVLVVDPGAEKAIAATRAMKELDRCGLPYIIFINKMDGVEARVKATLEALQGLTDRPLVLREIPIRDDDNVTGHVDLVSERAYKWSGDGASDLIEVPAELSGRTEEERTVLLEALADFNDDLLVQLLEDVIPGTEDVYENLSKDLQDGSIVPVFFGSAETESGIKRLMKALRHEAPEVALTAERQGIEADGETLAQAFKIYNGATSGKLTFARVWRGELADGTSLNGSRVSGIFKMMGLQQNKMSAAKAGDVVALGRVEDVKTGDALSPSGDASAADWPEPVTPVYALAIHAGHRDDEVKMATAIAKIIEEDTALIYGPNPDTGEQVIRGQGETHLRITLERLANRNKLEVEAQLPQVAYKESIRKPVSQHARHKKQSGGHGQFGDVHVEIKPLPRGSGFQFTDSISGGVVPKQYIPAVEHGVKEFLVRGPLGFPVVDVAVELTDGQFHAVDSSDQAFKTAGSLAMREGMPKCSPVLLEPIFEVRISVPTEFTSRAQRLISGRRGQILGFEPKDGWTGWDEVSAHMPESETLDLINELRSLSQGIASFDYKFDRLQEFSGKEADDVVAQRAEAN